MPSVGALQIFMDIHNEYARPTTSNAEHPRRLRIWHPSLVAAHGSECWCVIAKLLQSLCSCLQIIVQAEVDLGDIFNWSH
jgi:hypothetical protein